MKKLIRILLSSILLVIITGLVGWFFYWSITNLAAYARGVSKELGASLITAFTAVVVVTVGRFFERKRELDALYRDKKMEIYDEFLKKFFELTLPNPENASATESDDLVRFLREFMRKLVLWSGPEPIAAFLAWKKHLQEAPPNAKTIFLTENFLLTLRKDLRHSNRGIPKGFFATILLKEGELFLKMAKENPNITLDELSQIEKLLKKNSTD